jgi:hypothetical protein
MQNPTIDGAVIHGEAPFCHQFFNIPITEGVGQISTNTLEDHVVLKMSSLECRPLKDIVGMLDLP